MADPKNPKDEPEEDTSEVTADAPEGDVTDASRTASDDVEDAVIAEDRTSEGEDTADASEAASDNVADDQTQTDAEAPSSPWDKKADDTSSEVDETAENADTDNASSEADAAETAEDQSTSSDDVVLSEPEPEPEMTLAEAPEPQSEPSRAPDPAPQVIRETVVQKRAGFFPTLIGGVLAAGAGFLGAQYESNDWPFGASGTDPFEAQTRSTLDTQQETLDRLTERLGTVESSVPEIDTTEFETAVADLGNQVEAVSSRMTDLSDQIGLLQVRLVELEKAPIADTVSPDAIAAYERELDALRADITQQRTEIENMASEAMAAEENAVAQAELAKVRAALADLTAALESGQPFSGAVGTISAAESVPVPEVLSSSASDGVPTRGALVNTFPEAARAALAAAREAGGEDEATGNRFTVFLRDQLGARSVIPREGDDPDAVLSRAEAALGSGDLATVLSELDTLPPEAQAAMEGWIAQARLRAEAQDAAAALSQQLNKQ